MHMDIHYTLHHQCVDQIQSAFIVWQYRNHIHCTPSIVNVWTKYGQPSLYGNIETTHPPSSMCGPNMSALIVWQYRNHTYTAHPPSSMCGPNMVSLHCMAIQKPHIHCTPSIVNVWTKYGQLSLYGNIETTHTLHTLHHQCVDQIWSAFIVWQYRNHTNTTHPPSSMYGPNMDSLHCMAIQKPHIHYIPSIINVWTKYGQPSLHGNIENDLLKKT